MHKNILCKSNKKTKSSFDSVFMNLQYLKQPHDDTVVPF